MQGKLDVQDWKNYGVSGNLSCKGVPNCQLQRFVCCRFFPTATLMQTQRCIFQIGFRGCNTLLSPIKGETGFVKKEFLNHDLTMDNTYEMQRNFIQKQRPT